MILGEVFDPRFARGFRVSALARSLLGESMPASTGDASFEDIALRQSARDLPQPVPPRALAVGLGNPLLAGDGLGLHVVAHLRPLLAGRRELQIDDDYCGGSRLMERMVGSDRAIVAGALCGGTQVGEVYALSPEGLPTRHSESNHDVDLKTALALGRRSGAPLPADDGIRLVAVEAGEVASFSEQCMPPVQGGIGRAAEAVMTLPGSWQ